MKHLEIKETLKSILADIENTWDSKEREQFTMSKFLELEWLHDGETLKNNTNLIKKLKEYYFNYNHTELTSTGMVYDYYVIHEPFGNKSSPDYLFLTPFGFFGIEDKSSKNGSISWNTGTPGENKIITYFDKKEKKVYIITSEEYGWGKETAIKYREFTKEILTYAKNKFKEKFSYDNDVISNMGYYARPMLTDKNLVKNIYDPEEKNVDTILKGYLDNLWKNQNKPNTVNLIQELMNVN
jgi:hypothetical protein